MALDAKQDKAYATLQEAETKACGLAKQVEIKKVQQELKSIGL